MLYELIFFSMISMSSPRNITEHINTKIIQLCLKLKSLKMSQTCCCRKRQATVTPFKHVSLLHRNLNSPCIDH